MGFADALIHTVVTQRAGTGSDPDDRGLPADAYAENLAALVCRIWQKDGEENHEGRDATVEDWRLICAAGSDVLRTDRLTYGGRSFEIVAVKTIDASTAAHHIHCELEIVA